MTDAMLELLQPASLLAEEDQSHDARGNPSPKFQTKCKNYIDTVNHPNFRAAEKMTDATVKCLMSMGMTKETARGWIRAWASGAGDGSE